MMDVEELKEEHLDVLEREIQREIDCRSLSDFNLSQLTTQELEELIIKVRKQKAKGTFLDFHHDAISSKNWSKVMAALKEKEKLLTEKSRPLTIRLGENYLRDAEAKELCQYVLESKVLKKNLVRLELNHNNLKIDALPLMRRIIEECPNLKLLDAAINYLNYEAVERVFANMPSELLKKIKTNVY